MNRASADALAAVQAVCKPLVEGHVDEIETLIAPYYAHRHTARDAAEQFDSVNALEFFICRRKSVPHSELDAASAQLNHFRKMIADVLDGVAFEFAGAEAKTPA